jgi:phage shock protein PspC (stress-responsive transcriptional regulator)
MNRRLYRSHTESVLGGVAGGVAEYLDVDPAIVRVLWALLAIITGGVFFILYIVMWIVVPYGPDAGEAPAGDPATPDGSAASDGSASPAWNAQPSRRPRNRSAGGSWVFGLILVLVGLYLLAREYLPDLDLDRLWPLGLVLVGVVLLFGALRQRRG